jgi:hypothetical protein
VQQESQVLLSGLQALEQQALPLSVLVSVMLVWWVL